MSFIPIVNTHGQRWRQVERVRFYRPNESKPQFNITFTRPVAEKLMWANGDRLMVSFGVADNLGKLLISKVASGRAGYKLARQGNSTFSIGPTIPPVLGTMSRDDVLETLPKSGQCDFSILNNQLVVTLPPIEVAGAKAPLKAVK